MLDKIHVVIPVELRHHLDASKLFAPRFGLREDIETMLDKCRNAIAQHRYLHLAYQRADGASSEREVKPLGLFFWGNAWTLTGWCELRDSFRNFRLDRIRRLQVLEKTFEELPGQRLADFLAMMRAEGC